MSVIRVRFAPSPTGYLHIGGLRTALYCYLFARSQGGKLVLRIEDTDRTRFVKDAEDDIVQNLAWCGLDVDESPMLGGPFAPYRQSERQNLYRKHAESLVDSGHAYYAFDSSDSIAELRKRNKAYDASTRLQMDNSLTHPKEVVSMRLESGEEYVVRLCVPEDVTIQFDDLIKGAVKVDSANIDDQVLVKSDGMPTYHLANVVDDHHMAITHVIRGDEWIPSTPKHILLYQAFGWQPPAMAHLPLILSPTGGKLSKRSAQRQGIPINVSDYLSKGYEPQAVINFLALLGWNPGTEDEVFTLEELVSTFSLGRVGSAPAKFDLDKLNWFNAQHLRRLDIEVLLERVRPFLEEHGIAVQDAYIRKVCLLVHDRLQHAKDLATNFSYCFADPVTFDPKGVKKRWKSDAASLVNDYSTRLDALTSFSEDALEFELRDLAASRKVGAGRIIHPVRLAVSGTTAGPGLFALLRVLGQRTCVRRLRNAVTKLG
ncbi:MAG: glutamate--tRNA ligase [Rhodothermaceae bacterium]|nr:glutamate--tRNA ligase [Rhodothermaceae bacterium]MXX58335.1 glutamate--tRNA ligase [Rhodothermaceae bacterium]MYD19009.1 glutamate--tRNA ligase [Rhodothermaceae bacterium]MYD55403.1 glutamate--tRNA ligase [Rhodothermaceae bacterium]